MTGPGCQRQPPPGLPRARSLDGRSAWVLLAGLTGRRAAGQDEHRAVRLAHQVRGGAAHDRAAHGTPRARAEDEEVDPAGELDERVHRRADDGVTGGIDCEVAYRLVQLL